MNQGLRSGKNVQVPFSNEFSRRSFVRALGISSLVLALPRSSEAAVEELTQPIQLGLIADLHHDIMHDGFERLKSFVEEMKRVRPNAIMQLGDFAYPGNKNKNVTRLFNEAHETTLHVIGNHDLDAGFTKKDCVEYWGMPAAYYSKSIGGLQLIVLDGNDTGSPKHQGGYPSFIGKSQSAWLKQQLVQQDGPIIVVSHQPLAGYGAIDNAEEIQEILGAASDKIVLAINGHSHVDCLLRVKNVNYLHLNSASYQWVGSNHRHNSYPEEIHKKHPWISCTCPYANAIFATLTLDPANLQIRIDGRSSKWVNKSPAELGVDLDPKLTNGEEIAPRIRDRQICRIAK